MGKERRQSIRLSTRLSATFKDLSTGAVQRALTKDISGSGVCLVTEEMLEAGTPLAIEVTLPDRDAPIKFLADVVWSMPMIDPQQPSSHPPAETGLRFVSIDPKDRTLIMQYAQLHALPPEGSP